MSKALEIIKEKNIDISHFLESESLVQYNLFASTYGQHKLFPCKELTEQEYELLKEVLSSD